MKLADEIKRLEKDLTTIPNESPVAEIFRETLTKLKLLAKKVIKNGRVMIEHPECEECDVEMYRYEDSLDTGKGGYQCPDCGWSMDDAE